MVAFFENCAILIKDNTLKRRVHGMRDYREGQTERLLELPYSQSDGRPALSGFNTARQLPLRANEWQLSLDNCNQGGTACDTSLADRCKGLFCDYSAKL